MVIYMMAVDGMRRPLGVPGSICSANCWFVVAVGFSEG